MQWTELSHLLMNNDFTSSRSMELRSSGSTEPLVEESEERCSDSMARVRNRYLLQLGQLPMIARGYVPNIAPLLMPERDLTHPLTSPVPEGPEETRPFFGPGSLKSSMINISASTLGAGALALPHAFDLSGVLVGLVMMIFLFFLSTYSIDLLVRAIEMSGLSTYEELSMQYCGRKAAIFIEFNMIFLCFGTSVAYAIVIGSTSHSVIELIGVDCASAHGFNAFLCTEGVPLSIITMFLLLPLSLIDQLNELRFTSLLGVLCILYLIVVVVYIFFGVAFTTGVPETIAWLPNKGPLGIIKMLSLAVFSYCCQANVPTIYVELKDRSFRRMTKVARGSMSMCFVIYILMGLHGYLAFGSATKGNILDNLTERVEEGHVDILVAVAFIAMIFAVIMAYPFNMFPVRYSIETIVLYHRPDLEREVKTVRLVVTVCCVFLTLLCAILIPNIAQVFGLIGAFSGSVICYIAPALFYGLALEGSWFAPHKIGALCLLITGVIFMFTGTGVALLGILFPDF